MKMLKPQVAMLRTTQVKTLVTERTRGSTWMKTRHRILTRDNGLCRCEECRASGRILIAHEVDHVIPLHEGGADADHNLAAINSECHKRKSAEEASRRRGLRRSRKALAAFSSYPSRDAAQRCDRLDLASSRGREGHGRRGGGG